MVRLLLLQLLWRNASIILSFSVFDHLLVMGASVCICIYDWVSVNLCQLGNRFPSAACSHCQYFCLVPVIHLKLVHRPVFLCLFWSFAFEAAVFVSVSEQTFLRDVFLSLWGYMSVHFYQVRPRSQGKPQIRIKNSRDVPHTDGISPQMCRTEGAVFFGLFSASERWTVVVWLFNAWIFATVTFDIRFPCRDVAPNLPYVWIRPCNNPVACNINLSLHYVTLRLSFRMIESGCLEWWRRF